MTAPIQLLNASTGEYKWSDSDLLEVVTQATTQIDGASGWDTESDRTPTAREILIAINNALHHHFNEESKIIKEEINIDNLIDGYNRDDAELFLGRKLSKDEWYELKDATLNCDFLWEQIGEYVNDWLQENIINKED